MPNEDNNSWMDGFVGLPYDGKGSYWSWVNGSQHNGQATNTNNVNYVASGGGISILVYEIWRLIAWPIRFILRILLRPKSILFIITIFSASLYAGLLSLSIYLSLLKLHVAINNEFIFSIASTVFFLIPIYSIYNVRKNFIISMAILLLPAIVVLTGIVGTNLEADISSQFFKESFGGIEKSMILGEAAFSYAVLASICIGLFIKNKANVNKYGEKYNNIINTMDKKTLLWGWMPFVVGVIGMQTVTTFFNSEGFAYLPSVILFLISVLNFIRYNKIKKEKLSFIIV